MAYRNRRFDWGWAEIHRSPVPVISVGNLTVGGTGKTPLVKWIARRLRDCDVRVAILSRGYGAEQGGANDEALELELDLPDVPHLQNPDRVASAEVAVEELEMQVLLLDDGFQHRRLARDLDIVLLDALEPFGYGHLLPRGALREPCRSLARAHVVVLSRADLVDEETRRAIEHRVRRYVPDVTWCEVRHAPAALVNAAGERRDWRAFFAEEGEVGESGENGEKVAAFCGIGNPAGFRKTLQACGYAIAAWREFPDHHPYRRDDVAELESWCSSVPATAAICTCKDLVKLQVNELGPLPLWALSIETEFLAGREAVLDLILRKTLPQGE